MSFHTDLYIIKFSFKLTTYLKKYLASASRQATNMPLIFSDFLVIDYNKQDIYYSKFDMNQTI